MKPMDQDYIEKHDIAQRYLQGRLLPEEAQEFEVYLMDNPEALVSIEIDFLLKQGLMYDDAQKKPKAFWTAMSGLSHKFAMASALGVLLVVLFRFDMNQFGPQDVTVGKVHILQLGALRSISQQEYFVELNKHDTDLSLVFQPNMNETGPFLFKLTDRENDTEVAAFEFTEKSNNGDLIVNLKANQLKEAKYLVEFTNMQTGESKTAIMNLNKK